MPAPAATRARRAPAKKRIVSPKDFLEVVQFLDTQVLVERATELRVILLGTLAGVNVHQLGPPGVAKSLGLREFAKCVTGARYFEKALNAGMPPDAVIGPYDMAEFARSGDFVRKILGYAPTAHIIFLDEWFRSNGLMQDALLPLANTEERAAEHNGGMIACPTLILVSASNHMPDPDNEQAHALVDRITLMSYVERVKATESFKEIIRRHHHRRLAQADGTWERERKTITLEQVQEAQREVDAIVPSAEYMDKQAELRIKTEDAGLDVSDRRWAELGRVCRAQAWLSDRDFLIPEDLAVAEHGMWRDIDERPTAHELVLEFYGRFEREATKFRQEATEPLAAIDAVRPLVEGVPPSQDLPSEVLQQAVSAARKIITCKQRVDTVLAEAEREKRDASSLRDLANELLAQQLWLKQNKLLSGLE